MSLNAINRVNIVLRIKVLDFDILIPYTRIIFFEKTMNFVFTLIAIFALMSIAYGNTAVDEKKKESVRQGKMNLSVPFCVFPL